MDQPQRPRSASKSDSSPGGGHRTPEHTIVNMGTDESNGERWRGPAAFSSKRIRIKFIAKVYSILATQMVLTALLIAVFIFEPHIRKYMRENSKLYSFLGLGVFFVAYIVLVCCQSTRRSYPLNYILLTILTAGFALETAVLSCMYQTESVLLAVGATALATIVIYIIAKYSSIDITGCGCALCILSLVHMVVVIVLIAVLAPQGHTKTLSIVLSCLGAFLVSLYLLFDIQVILGGRRVELSPEEYILAAVQLYVDIIQLFQYMLMLIGGASKN